MPPRPHLGEPFSWPRLRDGYVWSQGQTVQGSQEGTGTSGRGRYLVPREAAESPNLDLHPVPHEVEPYDPTADRMLFLKFAEQKDTEAAIVEFANQYGVLGGVSDD